MGYNSSAYPEHAKTNLEKYFVLNINMNVSYQLLSG